MHIPSERLAAVIDRAWEIRKANENAGRVENWGGTPVAVPEFYEAFLGAIEQKDVN
jgi:hypothetical protein